MKIPLHRHRPANGYLIQKLIEKASFSLSLAALSTGSAQNTATASGAWSNCTTWGNPPAIYRNTTDTKTVNSGVTVTADANWSTGALVLNGSGAVNYNGGIFTDFVNDQGADVTCDAVYSAMQSAGCSSCGTYKAAGSGQYVPVTQAEYNAIRAQLSSITTAGSIDGQLNYISGAVSGTAETRSIGASQTKAPAGSYVVAFAVSVDANSTITPSTTLAIRIKYNTTASPTSGYTDYGYGYSGIISIPAFGIYYFVMKNPAQQTYSGGPSYLAYYASSAGIRVEGSDTVYSAYMSDSSTLSSGPFDYRACLQILTTPVKQWN